MRTMLIDGAYAVKPVSIRGSAYRGAVPCLPASAKVVYTFRGLRAEGKPLAFGVSLNAPAGMIDPWSVKGRAVDKPRPSPAAPAWQDHRSMKNAGGC